MRESGGDEVGSRGSKPKRGTDHSTFPISYCLGILQLRYSRPSCFTWEYFSHDYLFTGHGCTSTLNFIMRTVSLPFYWSHSQLASTVQAQLPWVAHAVCPAGTFRALHPDQTNHIVRCIAHYIIHDILCNIFIPLSTPRTYHTLSTTSILWPVHTLWRSVEESTDAINSPLVCRSPSYHDISWK